MMSEVRECDHSAMSTTRLFIKTKNTRTYTNNTNKASVAKNIKNMPRTYQGFGKD